MGADSLVCSCDDGAKNFCALSTGLSLVAAAKIAATGDQSQGHEHSEDRGEFGGKQSPMDIDKTEPVVALVKADVFGFVQDVICDTEVGLLVEDDGRGCSSGGSGRSPPLFEELLLADFVDNILGGSEHDEGEEITYV